MFTGFFYTLKDAGLKISMHEWLLLMNALREDLAHSSLLGFYRLCKAILVKTEADYDKFDFAFLSYFDGIATSDEMAEEFWKWLTEDVHIRDIKDHTMLDDYLLELEELRQRFEERKKEQRECHHYGNYWIGTGGTSTMGHGGYHERGLRLGGEGRHKSAVQVAGERNFKDFRQDNILDIRQFQIAFRKLRQFSTNNDAPKTELDIDATVNKTGDNAGRLSLMWKPPRKNRLKLLVLFDSGGSMLPYSRLCSRLFQSIRKSNHFSDIKIYYFHNCIYEHLYTTPACRRERWVPSDFILKNLDSEYRMILVGDGTMAQSELLSKGGNATLGMYNETPGIEWLQRFRNQYQKAIWWNPILRKNWGIIYGHETIRILHEMFPMYELTIDGLEEGIKKLLSNKMY
ncbi:MAG: VWA domain-containing protein [Clostridiales Family XIII bacterium]|jgi:uncharacterized protein with von Willebrand factor type A (vWA) domain|nr:VWA domain-containing protein [Clostridiales Family XIII bacterium]